MVEFKNRIAKIRFGVVEHPDSKWAVCEETTRDEMEIPFLDTSQDHSDMNYDEIRHIRMDYDPLLHWDELTGTFSVIDG